MCLSALLKVCTGRFDGIDGSFVVPWAGTCPSPAVGPGNSVFGGFRTKNELGNELRRKKKSWITASSSARQGDRLWRAPKCHGFMQRANRDEIENRPF